MNAGIDIRFLIVFTLTSASLAVGQEARDTLAQPGSTTGKLRPIADVVADIRASPGAVPPASPGLSGQSLPPRYLGLRYCWRPTNVSHGPLVFEEYNLERHGHSVGCLQPVVSGANFASSTFSLPWMALFGPKREYELGHIRPGSCAPFVVLSDGQPMGSAVTSGTFLLLL